MADLTFYIETHQGILRVTATGDLAFESTLRLLKHICDTAAEKQTTKILLNGLAVSGGLSTLERYTLGVEIAPYLARSLKNAKFALVGKPPAMDGFGVLVGQNRGANAEIFSNEQAALDWLGPFSD